MDYNQNENLLPEEEKENQIALKKKNNSKKNSIDFTAYINNNFDNRGREVENNTLFTNLNKNQQNDYYSLEDQSKFR